MASPQVSLDALMKKMDQWPQSWAGLKEDIPFGEALLAQMKPFMAHLHAKGFTSRTLRQHLDNLWAIGGEIIRELHQNAAARKKLPLQLLEQAVQSGEAPWMPQASYEEQRSCDATARKLKSFLATQRKNG